jgi:hypothetical protein
MLKCVLALLFIVAALLPQAAAAQPGNQQSPQWTDQYRDQPMRRGGGQGMRQRAGQGAGQGANPARRCPPDGTFNTCNDRCITLRGGADRLDRIQCARQCQNRGCS